MIAVFDNFIKDEQLLKEIETNYKHIFRDPGVYRWWDGWWNTEANNTTKKIIQYVWGDHCPITESFNIDGFEYWTGHQSATNVDDGFDDDLKIHFDKDEAWWDKTKEVVSPIIGSVYYPPFQDFEGGNLEIYAEDTDSTPEVLKAKPNRFIIFRAGQDPHTVTQVTRGTRNAIAINLWEAEPYSKQIGELDIE
jgi:hypothetical protein